MKKIGLLLIALCLFTLVGCFSVAELKSLEFKDSPAATYVEGLEVRADSFSIIATFDDDTKETLSLTNANLTVQGLNGEFLDTEEPGIHTLKVSYKGFSITFNYIVTGTTAATTSWATQTGAVVNTDYVVDANGFVSEVKTNKGLAYFAKDVTSVKNYALKTVILSADIDMQEFEWAPIHRFAGTFDGQGHSISNIRITKESHSYLIWTPNPTGKPDADLDSAAGLFGYVANDISVKNLTLVNTSIDVIQNEQNELVYRTGNTDALQGSVEQFKNYGAVVGWVDAGLTTIQNVNVVNGYFRGAGRLGGLIGRANNSDIDNCYVDASFVAYNPTTSSEFGEGEGDKAAGFIGQNAGGSTTTIDNSSAKVNIMGTRDLAGMIGYNDGQTTITSCQLLTGSVISASVAGGMALHKGARNVGGVIGTSANNTKLVLLDNVTVASGIVIVSNSLYAYSSAGKYVGGFRGTVDYSAATVLIKLITSTETIEVNPELIILNTSNATEKIQEYLTKQNTALAELNSK